MIGIMCTEHRHHKEQRLYDFSYSHKPADSIGTFSTVAANQSFRFFIGLRQKVWNYHASVTLDGF